MQLPDGPLSVARENSTVFCLNLVACTAYKWTIEALFLMEGTENINPQMTADRELYLTTLFQNPLEENV